MTKFPHVRDERTLPLQVQNVGFLLDRLGQDCHPLQFLRELTQNALEAIGRTDTKGGHVTWDVDWLALDADGPPMKLCVTDTGDGMTGDELVKFINQLSSSLSEQSMTGNFGVGAKISAATRNHAGLIYQSWKDGVGYMIHLWRDPVTGQYGLRRFERPDGSFGHYTVLDEAVRPEGIVSHGTKIILYGNAETDDTMASPEAASSPSRWVSKYLNSRYFRFPEAVEVRAREGWSNPRSDTDRNILRRLTGQAEYLHKHATAAGTVDLTNALAHWWVLLDEPALSSNSGFIESSGHVAALYRDELYELATGRSGIAMLQRFGVIMGGRRVVVYVEPVPAAGSRLTTNTARTQLLLNSTPLPWSEWALEFRERLPADIQRLMEEVAESGDNEDQAQAIRDRLKDLLDLYRVSRYRITSAGDVGVDDTRRTRGGVAGERERIPRPPAGGTRGTEGGAAGGVYAVFQKKDGPQGRAVRPDVFPDWRWVSLAKGSREPGDMEDRAAKFLSEQNMLLINGDFRVFRDMIDRWTKAYDNRAGVVEIVTQCVESWFAQALVETVIGLQALKDSKEWSVEEIERALSPEGLTAVVMSRYHVNNCVKRELGTKLGKLTAA